MAKKSKMDKYMVIFRMDGEITVNAKNGTTALNKVKNMTRKELIKKSKNFGKTNVSQWKFMMLVN